MNVAHLQGKRSGRPRGTKSTSPVARDLRWVARNLGKDLEPPSPGAAFWAKMAHDEPDKFVSAVAALEAANTRTRDEEPKSNTVDHAGQQLKMIFLTERDVLKKMRSYRANMPEDGRLVGCTLTRGGMLFMVRSGTFRPLAEGELIPELAPRFAT